MRCALAVALAIGIAAPDVPAQEARGAEDATIIVFGTVRNVSGVAVAGADVWIDGTTRRVVSNDSGEFRIDQVPSGRVRVMVRRIGFQPDSKRISVKAGDTRQVKFMLDGLLEELDAVIVTARAGASGRMQEFWARRMVGIGVFITRAEIERRHPPSTADLFQQVMGVRVIAGANGESTRLVTGRQSVSASPLNRSLASGACQMQYYVDGIFMTPGTFTVDEVTPDMVEAIEVFRGPSEIPARFRQRDTACGLVVIWTREPPKRSNPEQ
ncbi:MAG: TonB-dependent receptor [Gemmatimonadota bacterium]|nr:TonB-dependent receptor [Gemmatimonadota bacterium]